METVERLNSLLASFDECQISSFNGSHLIIIGDWDLAYHHNFEAEFIEVSYIQCLTKFHAQGFRLATPSERAQLRLADYTETSDHLFRFEADEHQFFIAVQNLELRVGLVLHQPPI